MKWPLTIPICACLTRKRSISGADYGSQQQGRSVHDRSDEFGAVGAGPVDCAGYGPRDQIRPFPRGQQGLEDFHVGIGGQPVVILVIDQQHRHPVVDGANSVLGAQVMTEAATIGVAL